MSLAHHFVSGNAYFSGGVLIAAAALGSLLPGVLLGVACRVGALIGMALVLLSATPQPALLYAVWTAALLVWFVLHALRRSRAPAARRWVSCGVALLSCGAMLAEVPHRLAPQVPGGGYRSLYVIGDSISSGLGTEDGPVWPEILQARLPRAEVVNVARPGATLSGALDQADGIEGGEALVVLEIGGNDLLAGARAQGFASGLEALLDRVCGPGRTVLMCELPLPPFRTGCGRAQRRLAGEYGVITIPRHLFAGVLAGRGNTVDGIHLSRRGHQRMAEMMASLLADAAGG